MIIVFRILLLIAISLSVLCNTIFQTVNKENSMLVFIISIFFFIFSFYMVQ